MKKVKEFIYLGVLFTSTDRIDVELSSRIDQASTAIKQLGRSVVRNSRIVNTI